MGVIPIQESWDVRIGQMQGAIIQLGYEGVTLEQVLEQRMKARAFAPEAKASRALETAEDALLYMHSPRLVRELGLHAIHLLKQETSAEDAPSIFQRARRLVHYYRTTPQGLPDWLNDLVKTGYTHYASLLPQAFQDQGTTPDQIAGMLGFIFTLESLALALGCQRSQLLIGLQGAALAPIVPDKIGLLWTSEWVLGLRAVGDMRTFFQDLLSDAVRLPVLPQYLNGFILALNFAPGIARFVVELLSHIYGAVADPTLIPWLPTLILQLRQHQSILQPLIKEASGIFPASLGGFANWKPAWLDSTPKIKMAAAPRIALTPEQEQVRQALFAHPDTTNALASWLGEEVTAWTETNQLVAGDALSPHEKIVQEALQAHPETGQAIAAHLGLS